MTEKRDDFEEKRKTVEEILSREGVVLAYLFGSVAEDEEGPLSDIDFAVYLDQGMTDEERDEVYMELLNELIAVMGDELDLVMMNDAGINMKSNVIRDGELLYSRSEDEKVKIESRILMEDLDTRYYRERHVEKRLEEIRKKGIIEDSGQPG